MSPYNDADVIAGQGTVAVELLEQLDGRELDAATVAAARVRRARYIERRRLVTVASASTALR